MPVATAYLSGLRSHAPIVLLRIAVDPAVVILIIVSDDMSGEQIVLSSIVISFPATMLTPVLLVRGYMRLRAKWIPPIKRPPVFWIVTDVAVADAIQNQ